MNKERYSLHLLVIRTLKPVVFQEVCYQYWPGQRTQSYGEFRIELISEESYNHYEDLVQQAKVSCVCTRYAFIELILNCPVQ